MSYSYDDYDYSDDYDDNKPVEWDFNGMLEETYEFFPVLLTAIFLGLAIFAICIGCSAQCKRRRWIRKAIPIPVTDVVPITRRTWVTRRHTSEGTKITNHYAITQRVFFRQESPLMMVEKEFKVTKKDYVAFPKPFEVGYTPGKLGDVRGIKNNPHYALIGCCTAIMILIAPFIWLCVGLFNLNDQNMLSALALDTAAFAGVLCLCVALCCCAIGKNGAKESTVTPLHGVSITEAVIAANNLQAQKTQERNAAMRLFQQAMMGGGVGGSLDPLTLQQAMSMNGLPGPAKTMPTATASYVPLTDEVSIPIAAPSSSVTSAAVGVYPSAVPAAIPAPAPAPAPVVDGRPVYGANYHVGEYQPPAPVESEHMVF